MGYRYSKFGVRPTTTLRWKSDAWHADGGANDEGFSFRWCSICAARTEHDLESCIKCDDVSTWRPRG